jgi:choline dehydrogenase-like flavoprotein
MSVVVIGSGPTGTAAALSLAERGVPVVMLEAGDGPLPGLQVRIGGQDLVRTSAPPDWLLRNYPEFENLSDPLARWARLEASGGMANVWGGVLLRCAPADFEPPFDGDERHRWPIGYDDLLPWYRRLEKLLWIRGSRTDVQALPASDVKEALNLEPAMEALAQAAAEQDRCLLPLPYVDGPPNRVLPCASPRQAFWDILSRLLRRRRVQLIRRARVTRLLPHAHRSMLQAVEYIDSRGSLHRLDADAVVLAAGFLASPRILLNSACAGHPDGIGNGEGLVGTYLHDNPLSYIHAVVDRSLPFHDGSAGGLYLTRRSDIGRSRPTAFQIYSGWAARFHPNLRMSLRTTPGNSSTDREGCAMIFSCYSTQTPSEHRSLRLHPSARDRHGLPLLQLDVHFGTGEHEALEEGHSSIRHLLDSSGWDYQISRIDPQPPGASVHWGGAARMHSDPKHGVLDAYNRCHEMANLIIVDASCFTGCIEKNPTLTAMAIAMRAADALAQTLKNP